MQDDDWFAFWLDIVGLTRACYDFKNDAWRFLPFSGGVFEQADKNPYLWSAINYIIQRVRTLENNDDAKSYH
jgi:hypothetical protein